MRQRAHGNGAADDLGSKTYRISVEVFREVRVERKGCETVGR